MKSGLALITKFILRSDAEGSAGVLTNLSVMILSVCVLSAFFSFQTINCSLLIASGLAALYSIKEFF